MGTGHPRLCEAAMLTLPLMGLFFLPVLIGAHDLFPWSRARSPRGLHKLAA